MPTRMYRVLILGLACLALGSMPGWAAAKSAEGGDRRWNRIHLKATPKVKTYRSEHKLSATRALQFGVYVRGREISGYLVSDCRYVAFHRRVQFELSNCGVSRVRLRYSGTGRFTFIWRLAPR